MTPASQEERCPGGTLRGCAAAHTKDDITELCHFSGLGELDIPAIKVTPGAGALRCKTPEMVRKGMWTCLGAYDLIRQTMAQSSRPVGSARHRLV